MAEISAERQVRNSVAEKTPLGHSVFIFGNAGESVKAEGLEIRYDSPVESGGVKVSPRM